MTGGAIATQDEWLTFTQPTYPPIHRWPWYNVELTKIATQK